MSWDERLFDLFDDLEGQAEALYADERDAEVADRSRAEYAGVTLAARLMASVGRQVELEVAGAGRVAGTLLRVGDGWCVLRSALGDRDWLLALAALIAADGLSERALPEVAWSPLARLGLGSALRRLADDAAPVLVITQAGERHSVVLTRVGADFVEGRLDGEGSQGRSRVVATATLSAVVSRC